MFDGLSDTDLVGELAVAERGIAAAQGYQLQLVAELHRRSGAWVESAPSAGPDIDPVQLTAAEVAPALAVSAVSAVDRVWLAVDAGQRLPAAVTAVAAGRLTLTKLRILAERTSVLSPDDATAVVDRVLTHADRLTPAMFGRLVARAVLRRDPAAADARHRAARTERRVDVHPAEDGMAVLRALLPAAAALRVHQSLTAAAQAEAEADRAAGVDDDRGIDARRADLLTDAILDPAVWALTTLAPTDAKACSPADGTGTSTAPRPSAVEATCTAPGLSAAPDQRPAPLIPRRGRPAWERAETQVHVVVPAAALGDGVLDSTDAGVVEPAELSGYGPVCDDLARELAAAAVWRRILTDPVAGIVTDVGRTSYHPPAGLADLVRTRDGTCRFPSCSRRAALDLDHTVNFPAGPTADANLEALCRSHHRIKTFTRWRVEQHTDGVLVWTSPTGYRYVTHPAGGLRSPQPDDGVPPDERDPGPEPDWIRDLHAARTTAA